MKIDVSQPIKNIFNINKEPKKPFPKVPEIKDTFERNKKSVNN